jgi:T5SS/PEP-CTERM-associated repeat protein
LVVGGQWWDEGTGTGTLTVSDEALVSGTGPLFVGRRGTGTLMVQAQANVICGACRIGEDAGGSGMATCTGAGSTVTVAQELSVGNHGEGHLSIFDGGSLELAGWNAEVGVNADGTGAVTVSGEGSVLSGMNELIVGGNWQEDATGTGSLTVSDGALVAPTGTLFVGRRGTGTLTIDSRGHVQLAGPIWRSGRWQAPTVRSLCREPGRSSTA